MKKVEISDTLAYILQRMIVDEINNQYQWIEDDKKMFGEYKTHEKVRLNIIEDLEEDRKNLSQQGLPIFIDYR